MKKRSGMPYLRFPIPEFEYNALRNMDWSPPNILSQVEIDRLVTAHGQGSSGIFGCYSIMPDQEFFDRFDLRGQHRHCILCLLPPSGVRMTGRSHAWFVNRALIVDSLDPSRLRVVADWKTTRPMNTRLGPDDGIEVGGSLYAVCSHRNADYWLVNRTLIDNEHEGVSGSVGARILSSSEDGTNNFHHANLTFEWNA